MAEWDTAYINDLPDSAFAVILPGGSKDEQGKTVPRSLRKLPHHNAQGELDLPHLRNAMSREPQSDMSASAHAKARAHLGAHGEAAGVGAKALKAEQLGTSKWRVLAIPFGGPFDGGKDLDGEYFSPRTDVKPHWFKERPVIFHHGLDQEAGDEDYGVQELDPQAGDDGWWGTVWLNRAARYWAKVDAMLRAGKMYGSSGAIGHLVRKDRRTGEILVWPHAEQTLTPTPANPYARITASKALSGFDIAGIALDDAMRGVLADLDAIADDLRPDLTDGGAPETGYLTDGGDGAAMTRLADALEELEGLIKSIRPPSDAH